MDKTQFSFLTHLVVVLIYAGGVLFALSLIPTISEYSISLFAGAGILAVAVGFAAQSALANVISGVILILFKPFRIGDKVTIDDTNGIVEDVTLRHTIIRNWEDNRVIIPNAVISKHKVENFNLRDLKDCKIITFYLNYSTDISKAMKIIREEAVKHKFYIDNRTKEEKEEGAHPVKVVTIDLNETSVVLKAYVWAETPSNAFNMGCDLRKAIKNRFDKAGFSPPILPHTILTRKARKKKR
jgi:small-conductance mechanosensitive channel